MDEEAIELVLGEPEPDYRCVTGANPTLGGTIGLLAFVGSTFLVGCGALVSTKVLPWISAPPMLVLAGALVCWLGVLLVGGEILGRLTSRPTGRFAFGEQIEVTLIEGWHALVSWGEVLSYRERRHGVELQTTRPPPRPNKAGLLPDLPQDLLVPTRNEAERAELLRLLRVRKIPRLG